LFSTEISRNTSKKSYLLPVQRQTIITKFNASVLVQELADKFKRSV
jgi:hypothetical protein